MGWIVPTEVGSTARRPVRLGFDRSYQDEYNPAFNTNAPPPPAATRRARGSWYNKCAILGHLVIEECFTVIEKLPGGFERVDIGDWDPTMRALANALAELPDRPV